MIAANYDLMKDIEARYREASGLGSRDHYSIFYGPLNKSPILMINANPGGSPANYQVVDVLNGQHEYIEGRNSGPTTRNGAEILTAAMGISTLDDIRKVQVLNRFFRRSPMRPSAANEAMYMQEAKPFLRELIQFIEPEVMIFGGDAGVGLFAKAHAAHMTGGAALMGPNGRSEAVYLREYKLVIPGYRPVVAFGIYHPSKLNGYFRANAIPMLKGRLSELGLV
ncbi:hypothetical protein [Sphingomonas montanisoli]|uniref:Uracil-DNA glycosylase-like domain-containing protein n=1 Tax=Sphingomonas montanisoli TaxID=2606412 RepID=A0A5D9C0I6_9SPHN|nr:hypothetical protein [Sphingomonas montanisoli]TZG25166.1 hypothetical protein FYJ91_18115 [Sphingomonas montanisoli]